jgi:hypothetical protein
MEQINWAKPVLASVNFVNPLSDVSVNISDKKAIVNPETDHCYGILSDRYKLVPHLEVLERVENTIVKHPEFGLPERIVKFNDPVNQDKMYAEYRFPEIQFEVKKATPENPIPDLFNPTLKVNNSYTGTSPVEWDFGAHRLVCKNGMVRRNRIYMYAHKHMGQFEEILFFQMSEALESYNEQTELWRTWIDKVLTTDQTFETIVGLDLGKKETENLISEKEVSSGVSLKDYGDGLVPQNVMTKWVLFNLICQFITHRVKNVQKQMVLQRRLANIYRE